MATDEWHVHNRADRIAAASEALDVVCWSSGQIEATLGVTDTPVVHDPLIYGAERGEHIA